jgi:hypothetical protein
LHCSRGFKKLLGKAQEKGITTGEKDESIEKWLKEKEKRRLWSA